MTRRHLALLALSSVVAVIGLWDATWHNNFDVRVYAGAVSGWANGGDLYAYGIGERHDGFTYPPFAAICMLPFTVVPLSVVIVANQVVIVLATLLALVIVLRRLPALSSHGTATPLILVLPVVCALQPVRDTFSFGQVNITLAALVLMDLVLIERGSRLAGVGTGLATAVKLTPGLFVVYLLCTRQWRAAGTAVAAAAAATLLAAAVAPGTSWTFWTTALLDGSRVGSYDSASNQSMAGVLSRLANSGSIPWLWLPLALLFACCALWGAQRQWQRGCRLTGLTMVGLTASVVSPISWVHHFWWVVPALLIVLNAALQRRSAGLLSLTAALTAVYLAGLPDLARAHAGHHHTLLALVGENALAVVTMLLVFLLPAIGRYDSDDSTTSRGRPSATASRSPITAAPAENPTTAVSTAAEE